MRLPPYTFVYWQDSIGDALQVAEQLEEPAILVRIDTNTWTSVSREKLREAVDSQKGAQPVSSVAVPDPMPHVYPDHLLHTVLPSLYEWPLLLVVHRANHRQQEGAVTLRRVAYLWSGSKLSTKHERS